MQLGIAIDFDGTCVKNNFPKVGEVYPHCVEALKKLASKHTLYLYTARSGRRLEEAKAWFKERGIPIHVQDAPNGIKIQANIYIDDKSLYGLPHTDSGDVDWKKIEKIVYKKILLMRLSKV